MSSFFWIRLWLETASGSVLFRERGNHEHRWEGNIRSLSMKLLEKAAESEGLQGDTGYDEFADMVTVDHDADVCWVLMQRNGREAADSEYESLLERRHGTWIGFTKRQKGHRIKTGVQSLVSQWRTSGEILVQTRHHGYSQLYDADYDEATRGTLLSFAIQNNLHVHQMDVVTALLNGRLEEEIRMEQPEGYIKLISSQALKPFFGNMDWKLQSLLQPLLMPKSSRSRGFLAEVITEWSRNGRYARSDPGGRPRSQWNCKESSGSLED